MWHTTITGEGILSLIIGITVCIVEQIYVKQATTTNVNTGTRKDYPQKIFTLIYHQ